MRAVIAEPILGRIHHRLAAALCPPSGAHVPLIVDGAAVGWMNHERAARLRDFDSVFASDGDVLRFTARCDTAAKRSEALVKVTQRLAHEGALSPWRDELYTATAVDSAVEAFVIERAAARYFGIATRAAHVNGLVAHHGEVAMWVARRSATKAIDPGQLDNLVAGGIRAGSSVAETLRREAWEEAGITASVVARAQPAGVLRICREQPDGLQREVIHVHDLRLPGDYAPAGIDGEAVAHRLVTFSEAATLIGSTGDDNLVTADASLVILDCLFRHGMISPDSPHCVALADLRWGPLAPQALSATVPTAT